MYDAETLKLLLEAAVFADIDQRPYGDSRLQPCPDSEGRSAESLCVEGVRADEESSAVSTADTPSPPKVAAPRSELGSTWTPSMRVPMPVANISAVVHLLGRRRSETLW